jgi:pyrroline-5-carboxylate reductase
MAGKSIGFIGGGRIVSVLLGGWARACAMPAKVVVFDPNQDVLARLKAKHPQVETTGDLSVAAGQDVVFLAVHPAVIKDVLPQVKAAMRADAVLVSLAPKFTVARLSEMLGGFSRIVRMIPNAPSIVNKGYNPVAVGKAVAGEKDDLQQLLRTLGDCPEVPEKHLEAYAIVTAMGPTYFWPQLYELKALGESFGLSGEAAMKAVDKMLCGTVATLKNSGLAADQVQDLIPVKPLADELNSLVQAARTKLTALMEKIRP